MNDEQKARVIANCETIAKALREGLALQWRRRDSFEEWADDDLNNVVSAGPHNVFRIKPEPRTIWVNEYDDGSSNSFNSEHFARTNAFSATRIAVEYREVVK